MFWFPQLFRLEWSFTENVAILNFYSILKQKKMLQLQGAFAKQKNQAFL